MSEQHSQSRLPWSQEAEQSLLGALMLNPDAMLRIADRRLTPAHFFDARNRLVWGAICELSGCHQPVDVVTTFERLQQAGKADDAGGMAYLHALSESVPSAVGIARYADIVADRALRRAIIEAADKAMAIARDDQDGDAALDSVASLFGNIKRAKAQVLPRKLGELVVNRIDHWQALESGDTLPGIPTGLAPLDEVLGGGLKAGKVIVLAARPSVGKTSLASQILLNVAKRGQTVLMLSQEMPAGDLVDRAMANIGHVPLDNLVTGKFDDDDWARLADAADAATKLPFFIDDQPALTLLDIRAKARQVQQRDGLAVLAIDYLQLCASGARLDKRHHQIEEISRGLKTIAKEFNVCVLALSQLTRESDRDEPELSHLKESGAIEEDADVVIMLHPVRREADDSFVVLAKIPKNRQGRRGRFNLSLHGKTQHWTVSDSDFVVSTERRRGAGK